MTTATNELTHEIARALTEATSRIGNEIREGAAAILGVGEKVQAHGEKCLRRCAEVIRLRATNKLSHEDADLALQRELEALDLLKSAMVEAAASQALIRLEGTLRVVKDVVLPTLAKAGEEALKIAIAGAIRGAMGAR